MTTTAFNLPSSPTSPASPISNPPLVLTVILTIGKCNAKRCFCLEGRFAAPSENPATLKCENCQHSFTHHTLNPSDSRVTALSVPVVHRLPKIPPFWSPRAAVVKNTYDRMIYNRVLHIRGTPASGKSILRLLLTRYIIVVHPTWIVSSQEAWQHHLQDNDLNGAAAFNESCLNLPRDQFYSTQDHVLLVDEAQLTYSNDYFWDSFLKLIDDTPGVHVIHFSYYGSPGRRPIELVGVTPPILHAAQRTSGKMKRAPHAYDAWSSRRKLVHPYVLDTPEIVPDLGASPCLGAGVYWGVNMRQARLGVRVYWDAYCTS